MRRRLALTAALAGTFALAASVVPSPPAGAAGGFQVRAFGGARALGAPGGALNAPLVGIAPTPRGRGYWLLARDGGIFTYGNARFFGSTGNLRLNKPVVGIASAPRGRGYWLVASDGGVFCFGDARFAGSGAGSGLTFLGLVPSATGNGYLLTTRDGRVFAYGDARRYGDAPGTSTVGVAGRV
jgi:hypothetical protein